MKKHRLLMQIFCLIFIILLSSGCSLVYVNKQSIDEILDTILSTDTSLKTESFDGYSYYLPLGVNLKAGRNSNSVLYSNHNKMYLYVDLVSYYHKVDNSYQINNNAYYSRKIDINGKQGYLEINEIDDRYYIDFMYNYGKIEAYVEKQELNKTLTNMAYILKSIKYKDSILEFLIGKSSLNYNEEKYNIYKVNGNDSSNFLEVLEHYDVGRLDSKDEDKLEIDKTIE